MTYLTKNKELSLKGYYENDVAISQRKKSDKVARNKKQTLLNTKSNGKNDNLDSLSIYLREISKVPLLTPKEELEVCRKITENSAKMDDIGGLFETGKLEKDEFLKQYDFANEMTYFYKNKMIRSNLRLVVSIAKKYQNRGLSLLDLIDEGNIGLIEAVERFDYTKGFRFSTYGTWWIKQAIVKALADKGRMIRIPIHMLNTIKKCYYIAKQLTIQNGKEPTPEEVSEASGIPVSKIKEITKIAQETGSLDTPLEADNSTEMGELLEDESIRSPFEELFSIALEDTIDAVLKHLSKREQTIIQLRYGLSGCGPHTLEETGQILGITRERVRQIQKKALMKLRNLKVSKELRDFKSK